MSKLMKFFSSYFAVTSFFLSDPTVTSFVDKNLSTKRIYVDGTLTLDEIVCIREASNHWVHRTKGLVRMNVVYVDHDKKNFPEKTTYNDIVIRKLNSDSAFVLLTEKIEKIAVYAFYEQKNLYSEINLVTDRYLTNKICTSVVMHELGHSLGLSHAKTSNALMSEGFDKMSEDISDVDIIEFCKIYNCKPDDFKE